MKTHDPPKVRKKPRSSLSGKDDEPRGNSLMGAPCFNFGISCFKLISTALSFLNRSDLFFSSSHFSPRTPLRPLWSIGDLLNGSHDQVFLRNISHTFFCNFNLSNYRATDFNSFRMAGCSGTHVLRHDLAGLYMSVSMKMLFVSCTAVCCSHFLV